MIHRRPLLAAAGAALASPALAQGDGRNFTLICPFPPGGSTDICARLLAPALGQQLGRNVVIENRAGAGGLVGTAAAAQGPADGHRAVLVFDTYATYRHLVPRLPYDPDRAFTSIALLTSTPMAMISSRSFGPTTVAETLAEARARPGQITYATTGRGSSNHMCGLLMAKLAGISMTDVSYRGAAPAVSDLAGGHVELMFNALPVASEYIRAGTVRGIAISSTARLPRRPDLPTIAETVPGYLAGSWIGMLVPSATPASAVAELRAAVQRAIGPGSAARAAMEERDFEVIASTPEAFDAHVAAESRKWGELIRENGITAEG